MPGEHERTGVHLMVSLRICGSELKRTLSCGAVMIRSDALAVTVVVRFVNVFKPRIVTRFAAGCVPKPERCAGIASTIPSHGSRRASRPAVS